MTDPLEGVPPSLSGAPDPERDAARSRFIVLQAMRFGGVLLAIFGALIIAGKVDLPVIAGYGLFLAGVIEATVVPLVMARAWKSGRR